MFNTIVLNHVQKTNYTLKQYQLQYKDNNVRNHVNSSMKVHNVLHNVLEIFTKYKIKRMSVKYHVTKNLYQYHSMLQVQLV